LFDVGNRIISAAKSDTNNGPSGLEDNPVLVIFNNKNSIQIAWGGKLPSRKPASRISELYARLGTVGLIRTYNAG
jgi:hypothetical protein